MPITEPIDEDELEADLAALEQENLDEKMLKTGTMPVADSLNRLPKAANGERKSRSRLLLPFLSLTYQSSPFPKRKGREKRRRNYRLTSHDTYKQSKGNRKRQSKKKTRRRNCGSCRRKWQCERAYSERKTKRNGIDSFQSAPFFVIRIRAYHTPFTPFRIAYSSDDLFTALRLRQLYRNRGNDECNDMEYSNPSPNQRGRTILVD